MKKSSNVRVTTAVTAFVLLAGLMLLPAASKGLAMSSTAPTITPQITPLANPSASGPDALKGMRLVMDTGFTPITMATAQLMASKGTHIHKVLLIANETTLKLPQGNVIHALTFNGTVPAPTIRVTQGDMINVTLANPPTNKLPHSLDNHAAIISAVPNFGPVSPGQMRSYAFIATQPGFFKYHCEGVAVLTMDQHVFS